MPRIVLPCRRTRQVRCFGSRAIISSNPDHRMRADAVGLLGVASLDRRARRSAAWLSMSMKWAREGSPSRETSGR